MQNSKYCGGCKDTKELSCFSKNQHQCKECKKKLALENRKNNSEKFKLIDKINNLIKKEKIEKKIKTCEQCKQNKNAKLFNYPYNESVKICKECIQNNEEEKNKNIKNKFCPNCENTKSLSEFLKNKTKKLGLASICKECFKIINNNYRKKNVEKIKIYNSQPHIRLRNNIRSRIRSAVVKKNKHTVEYLGCSIEECRKWLEYQFDENMTWNNYGSYWEIDHVTPCASFDMSNEIDIINCFNWTNLRPLESSENASKNDKIIQSIIDNHYKLVEKYLNTL